MPASQQRCSLEPEDFEELHCSVAAVATPQRRRSSAAVTEPRGGSESAQLKPSIDRPRAIMAMPHGRDPSSASAQPSGEHECAALKPSVRAPPAGSVKLPVENSPAGSGFVSHGGGAVPAGVACQVDESEHDLQCLAADGFGNPEVQAEQPLVFRAAPQRKSGYQPERLAEPPPHWISDAAVRALQQQAVSVCRQSIPARKFSSASCRVRTPDSETSTIPDDPYGFSRPSQVHEKPSGTSATALHSQSLLPKGQSSTNTGPRLPPPPPPGAPPRKQCSEAAITSAHVKQETCVTGPTVVAAPVRITKFKQQEPPPLPALTVSTIAGTSLNITSSNDKPCWPRLVD
eukprot:gnl/TRDRNA2_/TRDRNA2_190927_c0_seq1.p1 gnl/TRDRNA2_/TRDRNA2_190927_c0~~gnl/TRDRNA2_/TRDRNA2_190927_c0_seq1.p1  ORF type:complete len:398 (+),score=69.04 gnl/TRDRNA2_/TRDRNA2_190927_c0_seq1:160-1194(+)